MHKRTTLENGFEIIEIANAVAKAKIAPQGAHLYDYARRGETPLLWLSPTARFENGKAIRGGVPVCWPWFGKDRKHPERPQHGFARTAMWHLERIDEPDEGTTIVTLTLDHTQIEQPWFPYAFKATLTISVGRNLSVSLTTENRGDEAFEITEALHTYFTVGDIGNISIEGLENVTYADNLEGFKHKVSDAPITVAGEVDRVYLDTEATVVIRDDALERVVTVGKSDSRSTVVWNPWIDKAAAMADFADDGYQTMVCIETANALDNTVTIAPGASHTLTQTVS